MSDLNRKIYVVDNDLDLRSSLAIMLRSIAYDVELFDDGEAFLRTAQSGISGCIVLDVRLRGIGGLEIQRRLSEMGSVVPVIFITGHGDVEMAVKAMKAKAIDFLTKPVREQLLRRQRLLQPLSWHLLLRQQRNRLHHRQSLQRHLQPQSLRRSKSL